MVDAGSAAKGFVYNASATTPHYVYDANGNLVQDKHKDLWINYNPYNLPNSINNSADSYITITYTADGEKLTKVAGGTTRNYMAGIEYLGASLDAIYHAEGRCTPNGATAFYYEYTLKDHLGNARVNFRANGTAVTFLEEMHYYPFGMLMEGISTAAVTVNAYKYNGKEINTDLGLNWSDYGARWYDASVGRWWLVDPMAYKFISFSVYQYAINNPLIYIDPTGKEIIIFYKEERKNKDGSVKTDKNGKILYRNKSIIYKPGESYTGDNEFVQQVFNSLDYLQQNSADQGLISQFADDKKNKLRIVEEERSGVTSTYDPDSKTIRFNHREGIIIYDEKGQEIIAKHSPALILYHEIGHAFRHIYENIGKFTDPVARLKEEQYVVETFEDRAAITLGEGLRRKYINKAIHFYTQSATSTNEKK